MIQNKARRRFSVVAHPDVVHALAFSPDGTTIASASFSTAFALQG